MVLQYQLATSGLVNILFIQTVLKRHVQINVREHVSTSVQDRTLKSKTFWFSLTM